MNKLQEPKLIIALKKLDLNINELDLLPDEQIKTLASLI